MHFLFYLQPHLLLAAYFGSTVASYFTFLRTLFFLNLVTGIILFSFIGIPQVRTRLLKQSTDDTVEKNYRYLIFTEIHCSQITTGEFLLDLDDKDKTFGHFVSIENKHRRTENVCFVLFLKRSLLCT